MIGLYERENKQEVCNAILRALQTTRAAGTEGCNPLVELKYLTKENGMEIVRPIFEDGTGNNGYYDINVTADSGIAMFIDITNQFIRKMW